VVLQACLPLAFQALLLQATRSKERQAFFKILAVMPSLVQPLQQDLVQAVSGAFTNIVFINTSNIW
jgi:hypothetical protein